MFKLNTCPLNITRREECLGKFEPHFRCESGIWMGTQKCPGGYDNPGSIGFSSRVLEEDREILLPFGFPGVFPDQLGLITFGKPLPHLFFGDGKPSPRTDGRIPAAPGICGKFEKARVIATTGKIKRNLKLHFPGGNPCTEFHNRSCFRGTAKFSPVTLGDKHRPVEKCRLGQFWI